MAVADVPGVRCCNDAFGRSGFTANHQVVFTKVPLFKRKGHQRKQGTITPSKRVEKGTLNAMRSNRGGHARGLVEKREDVGLWKHAAQGLKDLFSSSHAQQPVMNESYTHSITVSRGEAAGCGKTAALSDRFALQAIVGCSRND